MLDDRYGGESVWFIKNGVQGFNLDKLPRCTAISKITGETCRRPAKKGTTLCGMHDGSYHPGARQGNQNSRKHGYYSKDAQEERDGIRRFIDEHLKHLEKFQLMEVNK